MNETAPCPWCTDGGRPFLHLSRDIGMSYAVRCNTCFARGPHVKIESEVSRRDWSECSEKAQIKATGHWNKLFRMIRGDEDEKSG